MITFIHGDDVSASRKYILEVFDKKQHTTIDGKNVDTTQLMTAFSVDGLFGEKKTILIDGFSRINQQISKKCTEYLDIYQTDPNTEIFVWDNKTIDKRKLSKFPKASTQFFPLPKYFFSFIDSIYPNNSKRLHELLFKLYPQSAAEQILYALVNRVRLLMMIKQVDQRMYDEVNALAPFQKTKLQAQAKHWTEHDIIVFYKSLFDTEVGMKTSSLPCPLINYIDLLLISL